MLRSDTTVPALLVVQPQERQRGTGLEEEQRHRGQLDERDHGEGPFPGHLDSTHVYFRGPEPRSQRRQHRKADDQADEAKTLTYPPQ